MRKFLMALFTLSFGISSAQTPVDSMTFENLPAIITVDSLDGSWQIGTPSKTIFDSAYSASHAVMTDTINPYPSDSVSFFYLSIDMGLAISYQLTFKHRYDFESGVDGGFIQFFDVGSNSWVNLNEFGMMYIYQPNASNYFPNDTINGIPVYSGTSNGWEEVTIDFWCMAVFQDPNGGNRSPWDHFMFRFGVFADGNSTSHEGWMIDDFIFFDFIGTTCSGIDEQGSGKKMLTYPNPSSDDIWIDLGEWVSNDLQLDIYTIDGKMVFSKSWSGGQSERLDISFLSKGYYVIKAKGQSGNYFGSFIKE